MATRPGFANARCVLEVDGAAVDALKSFSGLGLQAELALVPSGPHSAPTKRVSSVKWTAGHLSVGVGMGKGLYGWVKESLDKGSARRSGSAKRVDSNFRVQTSLGFKDATVTEFTVPTLDGASKEQGFFDVGFEAEQVAWDKGDGTVLSNTIQPKSKAWLCANFKVQIANLPCARVATVESFSWRMGPAGADVSDIQLSIAGVDQPAWAEAARKWLIEGQNGPAHEMGGRISLLSPTLKESEALGMIELLNVGFKTFSPIPATASSEQVDRFTVVLYVEKMLLNIKELET